MSFQDLNALHERLMLRLRVGKLDSDAYVDEFDRLVSFAGWSWEEYLEELDRNWTLKRNPVRAFVC
jgi:hypothetical protein